MLNQTFRNFSILCLVVIALSVPFLSAHAAQTSPSVSQVTPGLDLAGMLETVKQMAGLAVFLSLLVNLGKKVILPTGKRLIEDGEAPVWSAGLNLLALVVVFASKMAGREDLLPVIDAQAGVLAELLNMVLVYVLMILATRKAHDTALAGLPVVGKSYSGRIAGEASIVDLTISR